MSPFPRRALILALCLARASGARAQVLAVEPPRPEPEAASSEPGSRTVVDRRRMDDRGARGILDVAAEDVSVGENYAPLGYYEALSIRGFTLDQASGYRRDGLTVANESSMPLENKERVTILRGIGRRAGVSSPGGAVDYETKRPTADPVRSLTLERRGPGTRYAHADLGGRLGRFGWRLNAAREEYRPYVREARGRRDFVSAALEWRLGERSVLGLDGDWQKKSQLSVPGYQPLGGAALPPGVRPEKMLNDQPWSRPVVVEAHDLGARFSHDGGDWDLAAAVNRNRVLAEDKAAFPYGCSSGPAYLLVFCGDGDYDLYDYRSSGERREVLHAQAVLGVEGERGGLFHEAEAGVSRLRRTVDLGAEVYDYVGTANIYDPAPRAFAPSSRESGVVRRVQDYVEWAVFAGDAVSLAADRRWKVHAGLRASAVSDDRWAKADGSPQGRLRRTFLSPRAALSVELRPGFTAYASYGQGLELGGAAPVTAANAGRTLDPKLARQVELGVQRSAEGLVLAAAAFHIWKPYEFVGPDNVFVRRGRVRHSGLELSASGSATDRLRVSAGAALINARQGGTGVAAFEGRAPVNVPWLRGRAALDWELPWVLGAAVDGAWTRVSAKYATRDNALAVPAYHRLDAGLRWATHAGLAKLTWRLRVENLLDAVYWKDVGEYFGDGYLHLGAPRTLSLSIQMDF